MANQPHPSKQAVTWRLHRDLVARTKAAAKANRETELAFATRALEREIERSGQGRRTDLTDHTEENPDV